MKKESNKWPCRLTFLIIGFLLGYFVSRQGFLGLIDESVSYSGSYYNETLLYGDTGAPKNCRAIITTNINSYKSGEFSAGDVLSSIDRNCGEFGYSWEPY